VNAVVGDLEVVDAGADFFAGFEIEQVSSARPARRPLALRSGSLGRDREASIGAIVTAVEGDSHEPYDDAADCICSFNVRLNTLDWSIFEMGGISGSFGMQAEDEKRFMPK
jgi:hypothetical protein